MPIREVREDDLDQECSKCGNVVTVAINNVEAGIVRES